MQVKAGKGFYLEKPRQRPSGALHRGSENVAFQTCEPETSLKLAKMGNFKIKLTLLLNNVNKKIQESKFLILTCSPEQPRFGKVAAP
jgi:hypothetical protein